MADQTNPDSNILGASDDVTLLDFFAAHAMGAMCTAVHYTGVSRDRLAANAYAVAHEMIIARNATLKAHKYVA